MNKPHEPEMRILDYKIPKGVRSIRLAILADWHWGSPQCREGGIKKFVSKIEKDKDCYWIGAGDLMENALLDSLGDVYKQKISPDNQLYQLVLLLQPIASRCIGMITGNHGQRTAKRTALDPDRILCNLLGMAPVDPELDAKESRYYGFSMQGRIMLDSAAGATSYYIAVHHTTGGGRTKGGKINALIRMADVWPAMDIYIGAHSHANQYVADTIYHCEPGNKGFMSINRRIRHFTGAGSGLDYVDSYGHAKLMPPASAAQVILHLGTKIHAHAYGTDARFKPFAREVVQL